MSKDDWKEAIKLSAKTRKGGQTDMPSASSIPQETAVTTNVVYLSPKTFGDVKELIDNLKNMAPVIFNLEGLSKESGQRILDYIAGAAYALGGSMKRIKEYIFLATPKGVGIAAQTN